MTATTKRVSTNQFRHLLAPLGFALAVLVGCGDTEPAPAMSDPTRISYSADLEVDLSAMEQTPSGLYQRDLVEGTGEVATAGQIAVVHYTGWLPNGEEFDSSVGGSPFEFALGQGTVIDGWDEGVAGMRVGGRRQLVLPPDLGYGAAGAGGVIPPNAVLVFEVELLDLR